MGTWGTGIFEDDTACDTRDTIAEASDVATDLERRLRRIVKLDPKQPLMHDACFDALVPAAIVDAYVNGTDDGGLDEFRALHPKLDLRALAPLAAAAISRVLEPNAELYELWAENEDDSPEWKAHVENVRARLAALG